LPSESKAGAGIAAPPCSGAERARAIRLSHCFDRHGPRGIDVAKRRGMKTRTRWILSVVTGVLSVPAAYGAAVLLCGPAPVVRIAVLANALALIP